MQFIIHTLPQAIAALSAGAAAATPVTLLSPPYAAQSLGAGYFLAMITAARAAVPGAAAEAVLDCGEAPGLALSALRMGLAVRLSATPDVLAKIDDIAGQSGGRLVEDISAALDLSLSDEPLTAARRALRHTD